VAEWIIGGKRYSIEEYEEYQKQELKRWELDEAEVRRLVGAVGEAFTACEKFMEEHPQYPYGLKDDAQQREFKIFEKLRWNLGAANRAPRCEKVREDGTVCGCPQMKGYSYCYAHERMLRMQSQKLELPTQEDGNGIQMAIMRVQKALIDDEISTKKAGQLLYSLQMASSNLKHTTFASAGEKATVEMKEPPRGGTSRVKQANGNWQMANSQTQHLTTETQRHGEDLSPQMNADKRRSGKDRVIEKSKSKNLLTTEDTKGHGGKTEEKADPSTALGTTNSGAAIAQGFKCSNPRQIGMTRIGCDE
jgi:hypothetical protein